MGRGGEIGRRSVRTVCRPVVSARRLVAGEGLAVAVLHKGMDGGKRRRDT